jgi:hypothetical protein
MEFLKGTVLQTLISTLVTKKIFVNFPQNYPELYFMGHSNNIEPYMYCTLQKRMSLRSPLQNNITFLMGQSTNIQNRQLEFLSSPIGNMPGQVWGPL